MEVTRMEQQAGSRKKALVGGLLAAGIALTGTVAMAARGPSGGDYGTGDYEDSGYGRKNGHRLHCPSYNGMYHSNGRATCHMAPRRAGVGTGDTAPANQTSGDSSKAAKSAPSAPNSSNGPKANGQPAQASSANAGQPAVVGKPQGGAVGNGGEPKQRPNAGRSNAKQKGHGPKQG